MQPLRLSLYDDKLLNPNVGLKNIHLTRQGILDWIHYYVSYFLHKLNNRQKKNYDLKLVKFLIRISLGHLSLSVKFEELYYLKQKFFLSAATIFLRAKFF